MARAVTLLVEDGSVVVDANSFVTEAQIVAYAAARGVTVPANSEAELDAVAVLGIKAMDYLRIMPWKGEVVDPNQTTPWPRKNMDLTPSFPEDKVPAPVIEAQLQLTLLANAGTVLIPTSTGMGFLVKEKIGPLENIYSEKVGIGRNGMPILPGINSCA